MNKCGRCGFETSQQLRQSILEPWILLCPICYRAENKTISRQKQPKFDQREGLCTFLKTEKNINKTVKNIFRNGFKIKITEKKTTEIEVEKDAIQEEGITLVDGRMGHWWVSDIPIERVPGTAFIMQCFKDFAGYYYLDEEQKNAISLADIRSYQGKKREVTARWLLDNFSNSGDVVLDPFSGSGMFSLVAKVSGRKPIAFDILQSAVASTKALICTPSKNDIIRIGERIVQEAEGFSIHLNNYPKSIRKWYDLDAFKRTIPFFEVIQLNDIGMDERMQNFQTQIALYLLQRISYGRGGYSWRIDEKEFRRRALWDKNMDQEYMRHIKKVTRSDISGLYNTDFKASKTSILEHTGLPDGSVDRIITDPPYGDMINYIAQVWVEEWYLGWKDIVSMDELLGVSATPKKALDFAHRHMIQDTKTFFERMEVAMKEMYRVLRSDGTATFIIGDFKEQKRTTDGEPIVKIINPFRPLEKIARRIGFEEVYCINKPFERQSTYKHTHAGEQKFERIIIFRKGTKEDDLMIDRIIEKRKIGLEQWILE